MIAAQLRNIASILEAKLKDYNWNVKTITLLAIDQEELFFINWCTLCQIVIIFACAFGAIVGFYGCVEFCMRLFSFNPIVLGACIFICAVVFAILGWLCTLPAYEACKALGFC